jgi:hypothetical protein
MIGREMSWTPILVGDDAARARAVIARTVATMAEPAEAHGSLVRGWPGVALVHGYLALDGDDDAVARAHDALARALGALAGDAEVLPWLADGTLGLGWALAHLSGVVELDDALLAAFDEIADGLLARDRWTLEYELLYGLVGVGVYALERGRAGTIARVLAHLDRVAARDADGATFWNHDAPEANPRGYRDLGMAHGATGVVALLAAALAAGVADARPLLADAIAGLLATARPGRIPYLPRELDIVREREVLNGWCYGDLPVACALVAGGRAAGEPAWIDRGRALARGFAASLDGGATLADLALCHGTAGRAHQLHRLARALDDAALLDAARRSYLEMLDALERAGLTDPALLHGASGVALALLGAVSAVEPSWDRALLVALPSG